MYCYFSCCLHAYFMLLLLLLFFAAVVVVAVVFLKNKCKFAAYNSLQISCISTLLLINSNFNSFLILTTYNLGALIVLCSFIISVRLIRNVESLYFYMFFIYLFFYFMFVNFNIVQKKN